jgi:hypothetical protein
MTVSIFPGACSCARAHDGRIARDLVVSAEDSSAKSASQNLSSVSIFQARAERKTDIRIRVLHLEGRAIDLSSLIPAGEPMRPRSSIDPRLPWNPDGAPAEYRALDKTRVENDEQRSVSHADQSRSDLETWHKKRAARKRPMLSWQRRQYLYDTCQSMPVTATVWVPTTVLLTTL